MKKLEIIQYILLVVKFIDILWIHTQLNWILILSPLLFYISGILLFIVCAIYIAIWQAIINL